MSVHLHSISQISAQNIGDAAAKRESLDSLSMQGLNSALPPSKARGSKPRAESQTFKLSNTDKDPEDASGPQAKQEYCRVLGGRSCKVVGTLIKLQAFDLKSYTRPETAVSPAPSP